jgi:hypothetical protein
MCSADQPPDSMLWRVLVYVVVDLAAYGFRWLSVCLFWTVELCLIRSCNMHHEKQVLGTPGWPPWRLTRGCTRAHVQTETSSHTPSATPSEQLPAQAGGRGAKSAPGAQRAAAGSHLVPARHEELLRSPHRNTALRQQETAPKPAAAGSQGQGQGTGEAYLTITKHGNMCAPKHAIAGGRMPILRIDRQCLSRSCDNPKVASNIVSMLQFRVARRCPERVGQVP